MPGFAGNMCKTDSILNLGVASTDVMLFGTSTILIAMVIVYELLNSFCPLTFEDISNQDPFFGRA